MDMAQATYALLFAFLLTGCFKTSYPAKEFVQQYEKKALQSENRNGLQISGLLLRDDYIQASEAAMGFQADSQAKGKAVRYRVLIRKADPEDMDETAEEKARMMAFVRSLRHQNMTESFWLILKSGEKEKASACQYSQIPSFGNSLGFTLAFNPNIDLNEVESIEIRDFGMNLGTIRFQVINPTGIQWKVGA
jgi:hypothetical protein